MYCHWDKHFQSLFHTAVLIIWHNYWFGCWCGHFLWIWVMKSFSYFHCYVKDIDRFILGVICYGKDCGVIIKVIWPVYFTHWYSHFSGRYRQFAYFCILFLTYPFIKSLVYTCVQSLIMLLILPFDYIIVKVINTFIGSVFVQSFV